MAPVTRRRKKALTTAPPAPAIDPADRLSRLPDEILAQILSLLPAQEAVRTSILARTWRHVWKITRRLLITGNTVKEAREFVDSLLRVRRHRLKCAPLDACEIMFDPNIMVDYDDNEDVYYYYKDLEEASSVINSWIRRVLKCQVKALRVDMGNDMDPNGFYLGKISESPCVSRHLTRIELRGVMSIDRFDFSGCPALEVLEISYCDLGNVEEMASLSLKRLLIKSSVFSDSENVDYRFRICAPRLVSLRQEDMCYFRTPLLESMPELVEAYVQIGSDKDRCSCDDPMGCYHVMRPGHISDSDDEEANSSDDSATTKCVLLEGLAQAKHIVMTSYSTTYIFRRDLRWCPTFSKLKTLVLNDNVCEPADRTLPCFLERAPVLEKLTVLFFYRQVEPKYKVDIKGRPDETDKPTKISQHLQIVEIKCEKINQRVHSFLNFMGTLNIWFKF